jgi:hypothetical protein
MKDIVGRRAYEIYYKAACLKHQYTMMSFHGGRLQELVQKCSLPPQFGTIRHDSDCPVQPHATGYDEHQQRTTMIKNYRCNIGTGGLAEYINDRLSSRSIATSKEFRKIT